MIGKYVRRVRVEIIFSEDERTLTFRDLTDNRIIAETPCHSTASIEHAVRALSSTLAREIK